MRVIFAGTPEVAVPTLNALVDSEHTVVAVLTREDAPQGRRRVLTPSPVAVRAGELGIPTIKSNRITPETHASLAALRAEIGVVVAFGCIIPQATLDVLPHGWLNLHFSLLPEWRGAAPVQRALMAGDERLGVSVFRLVRQLDAGDVLRQRTIATPPRATAGEVLAQFAADAAPDVCGALDEIAAGRAVFTPQSGTVTVAEKLSIADARLGFHAPARQVFAQFRGVTPEPGAFVLLGDQRVKVLSMAMVGGEDAAALVQDPQPVGTLVQVRDAVGVWAADAPLLLLEVQPAGKRPMPAGDWFRGWQGAKRVE